MYLNHLLFSLTIFNLILADEDHVNYNVNFKVIKDLHLHHHHLHLALKFPVV